MDEYHVLKRELARLEGQIAALQIMVFSMAHQMPDRTMRIIRTSARSALNDAEGEAYRREVVEASDFSAGLYDIAAAFCDTVEDTIAERATGARIRTIQPHPDGENAPYPGVLDDDAP